MDSYEKTGYLTKPYKMFHITDKSKLDIPFHYHDFHKILIHIKGNVSYCIEGRNYKLQPYDIVLVNAGEVHRPILMMIQFMRGSSFIFPKILQMKIFYILMMT